MPAFLKLNPSSGKLDSTNKIGFTLYGLSSGKNFRISFENASANKKIKIIKSTGKNDKELHIDSDYVYTNENSINGFINLDLPVTIKDSVISVFASIENKNEDEDNKWELNDIAAFAFSIESETYEDSNDRIQIEPSFIETDDKATITINSSSNKDIFHVFINNKKFIVKTNYNGYGTVSFGGNDIKGSDQSNSKTIHKFPVTYSKSDDNFENIYNTSSYIHVVPSRVMALQAAQVTEFEDLECVVIDPNPPPSATVQPAGDTVYCQFDAIAGSNTIFDNSSNFANSLAGFSGELNKITNGEICRVNNSISSSLLPNGVIVSAFSSQTNKEPTNNTITGMKNPAILASRIFVAVHSGSMKFRVNPIRNGIILNPSRFEHRVRVVSIDNNNAQRFGLVFRIKTRIFPSTNDLFEVIYGASAGESVENVAIGLVLAINKNANVIANNIIAERTGNTITVSSGFSNFTVSTEIHNNGNGSIESTLNTNDFIDLLVNKEETLDDVGDTVVFLNPKLSRRSFEIDSKIKPDKIRLSVPEGVNNGVGPTITDNIVCNDFVILDSNDNLQSDVENLRIIELPILLDENQNEIPIVNPSITATKDFIRVTESNNIYVYVVAQGIVNGDYQLFFFGWKWGDELTDPYTFNGGRWERLTYFGENKNPKIDTDRLRNLHIVWESDRNFQSQLYYSCLGPSSRMRNNQVMMSFLDKITERTPSVSYNFPKTQVAIQDTWLRFVSNKGKISVSTFDDITIEVNPSLDGALAVARINKDENGLSFNGKFDKLNYELSFDFNSDSFERTVKNNNVIGNQFSFWKTQFTPIGDRQYILNENIFFIDKSGRYFENIIPIAGSYDLRRIATEDGFSPVEIDDLGSLKTKLGNTAASAVLGINNKEDGVIIMDQPAKLSAISNVRHWMIGLMAEKVRFKAVNTEPLLKFCEREKLPVDDCANYIQQIEKVVLTGRYKPVMVIATSDDDSNVINQKKRFKIFRQFGKFIKFSESAIGRKFKITAHYSRNPSDDILNKLNNQHSDSSEQDNRFLGSISCAIDGSFQFAQSFFADFSDQYRTFDIGLGTPSEGKFLSNEILPFNGNVYEDSTFIFTYKDIVISPASIVFRDASESLLDLAVFPNIINYNSSSMQEPSCGLNNLINNGNFEDANFNPGKRSQLANGDVSVTNWTGISSGFAYIGDDLLPVVGKRMVSVIAPNDMGGIRQSIVTESGKLYSLQFYMAAEISGNEGIRSIRVTAGNTTSDFSFDNTGYRFENLGWIKREVRFLATGSSTNIDFENITVGSLFGIIIDNVAVFDMDELPDELSSIVSNKSILINNKNDFWKTLGVGHIHQISQIPITIAESETINKNADIVIDSNDVLHMAFQSNKNGYWDIFTSDAENRSLPFRNEIRISKSKSQSLSPSIGVGDSGKRLIAWHDDRNGKYQIFSAMSRRDSRFSIDQCESDLGKIYAIDINANVDPYDSYGIFSDSFACEVMFNFTSSLSDTYNFDLDFYSDAEFKNLVRSISTKKSIAGWRINELQFPSGGIFAEKDDSFIISYEISKEDSLSGRVLYIAIRYNPSINWENSTNIAEIDLRRKDIDFRGGQFEDNKTVFVFKEFNGKSPLKISSQNASFFNNPISGDNGIIFSGIISELPGIDMGDSIEVHYFHFDVEGDATDNNSSTQAIIQFVDPIVGIIWKNTDLDNTDQYFALSNVLYEEFFRGLEFVEDIEFLEISSDRKTLIANLSMSSSELGLADSFRVVTSKSNDLESDTQRFSFYCPKEQSKRCNIDINYKNNFNVPKNIHFRVNAYSDPEREAIVFSAFTLNSSDKWSSGFSEFPAQGISVDAGKTISVVFDPEILPFSLYELQDVKNRTVTNRLLCGVSYYFTIESFVDNKFEEIDSFPMTCPCSDVEGDLWPKETDEGQWISSGQGKDDLMITKNSNISINAKVVSAGEDVMHIVWEDYRHVDPDIRPDDISPDYFMATWFTDDDRLISSGQGFFDRRITNFVNEGNSKVLYDASIVVDQFRNINIATHDGSDVFEKSVTIACPTETIVDIGGSIIEAQVTQPCEFTDNTNSLVGGEDRDNAQYQKIRVAKESVAFSTFLNSTTPISVVNDCFIKLDIIGVPGTYAYRLRNEDTLEFSQWIPVGPNLPVQPAVDGSGFSQEEIQKEQDYFRAYFVEPNRFIAPWILSSNNGNKKIFCEILTFFGKSSVFSVDILSIYNELVYSVELFYDLDLTKPVGVFNGFPVIGDQKTTTQIMEDNLISITEETEDISTIFVKIIFSDLDRLRQIEKAIAEVKTYRKNVERRLLIGSTDIYIDVFQQGLREQRNIELTKIEDGVFTGSFLIAKEDGIFDIDGLSMVIVNVPGACVLPDTNIKVKEFEDTLFQNVLISDTSIFNDLTLFRQKYNKDDTRRSFGNPDYFRENKL